MTPYSRSQFTKSAAALSPPVSTGLKCAYLVALLLALTGCSAHENIQVSEAKLVVVGPEEHYFGVRQQRDLCTHTFTVKNEGSLPARIVELRTSCSCLVAVDNSSEKNDIAPGEQFEIPIRFTTSLLQETASGRVLIGYRSADKTDGKPVHYIDLRVRADIMPDYKVSPRDVDFGEVDGLADMRPSRIVRIAPEAVHVIEVKDVTSPSDFLTARILPRQKNDGGVEVEVNLDVTNFTESRSFNGSVVISTDSERIPKVIVPVRGAYKAPAEVEPSMILITSAETGVVRRDFRISGSHPMRILRVVYPENQGISVQWDDKTFSHTQKISLQSAPRKEKAFTGNLIVELQYEFGGERCVSRSIRIPVYRFVERNGG